MKFRDKERKKKKSIRNDEASFHLPLKWTSLHGGGLNLILIKEAYKRRLTFTLRTRNEGGMLLFQEYGIQKMITLGRILPHVSPIRFLILSGSSRDSSIAPLKGLCFTV